MIDENDEVSMFWHKYLIVEKELDWLGVKFNLNVYVSMRCTTSF